MDEEYTESLSMGDLLERLAMQDGALIEVCVTSASYEKWVATVEALAAKGFSLLIEQDDVAVPTVVTIDMFTRPDDISFALSVAVGRQCWTTGFYSPSLIDFQGEPRDIFEASDVEDVREFMQVIADATGQAVRMIPETLNYETAPAYLTIDPRKHDQ